MRFFLCRDRSKFTKSQDIKQYGDWYFIHEDDVKVYEDNDHLVLYCGYLIEGDIIEACKNFSFDNENGNFFAIKLTKDTHKISLDYFQNHKIKAILTPIEQLHQRKMLRRPRAIFQI